MPATDSSQQAAPLLLEGLSRLEHRGYDSAGVAVLAPGKGSPLRVASDREDALSWLGKSLDAWRASQELLASSAAAPKLNLTAGNA